MINENVATVMRRWIVLASVILLVLNLATFVARYNHWADLATHFRLQYIVCAALGALALGILRRPRWIVPLGLIGVFNAWLVAPYFLADSPTQAAGERIRILHANVQTSNTDAAALLELIEAEDPDLIFLQEVDQRWLNDLRSLEAVYLAHSSLARPDNFGIAAYSRLPTTFEIKTLAAGQIPVIRARVTRGALPLDFLSVHTVPPMSPTLSEQRNLQLAEAANLLTGMAPARVLIGDLNITPWSPFFRDLTGIAKLRDARLGTGTLGSWPQFLPFMKIPIDHCLISDRVRLHSIRRGPAFGSDHRPLILELQAAAAPTT